MIDVNALRKGVNFTMDGELYKVLSYQHHKPGRGKATIRTTLRNLRTGSTIQHNFISGDRVEDIRLESRPVEYLYKDGELLVFMDIETFDQPLVPESVLGDSMKFIRENVQIKLLTYEDEIIDFELPLTMVFEVADAEAAVAGDTATGATKKIITDTGLEVTVPLFVDIGDKIKVNTDSGEYITRA